MLQTHSSIIVQMGGIAFCYHVERRKMSIGQKDDLLNLIMKPIGYLLIYNAFKGVRIV